ncbi:MAG: flagellar hook-basal body complex protein FliE [Rickettsiales bacterium]|nr:flagellar hook-basal body complex protein FliE [Rickettsiales bacterium]
MSSDLLRGISAYNNMSTIPVSDTNASEASSVNSDSVFSDMIRNVVDTADKELTTSENLAAASLVDKAPLHEVVLSVNEAEIALRTVVSIRDRVISAYQDIIKMPI